MKKTEALLKAIGIYIGINASCFLCAYIFRWVALSPFGVWLEINRPSKPYVPGALIVMQFIPLMIAFYYYRDKVRAK